MRDRPFVDSNILIYSLMDGDGSKGKRARALLADGKWITSTQVILETSNVLRRKFNVKPADLAHGLRGFLKREVVAQTSETVENAWRIMDRYGLSTFDSAIVAAAISARCTMLVTEDLQHGQQIETVRIVNPFV